jgi:hypothetical protein
MKCFTIVAMDNSTSKDIILGYMVFFGLYKLFHANIHMKWTYLMEWNEIHMKIRHLIYTSIIHIFNAQHLCAKHTNSWKNNSSLPIVRWEVYDEISPSISTQSTHLYVQKNKYQFVYKSNLHKMSHHKMSQHTQYASKWTIHGGPRSLCCSYNTFSYIHWTITGIIVPKFVDLNEIHINEFNTTRT